jgi:hypothetical protein
VDLGTPGSYLTLAAGVPVYSSDGLLLGEVEHVLAEPDKDIFDGIVFRASPLGGGHRFVDAAEVAEIHERGVVLALDGDAAERLHEPGPDHTTESELERKLRRAWDLISGNY